MNSYDLFLLIMAGVFALLGLYWGLIRQILSIVGLIVGIVLAGRLGPNVADWLSSFVGSPEVAGAVGYLGVLIGISSLASLLASLLRMFVGLLFLGWLDHLLGGVLGLIQAVLAGAALTVGFIAFPSPAWTPLLDGSQIAGVFVRVGGMVTALLPSYFESAVRAFLGN